MSDNDTLLAYLVPKLTSGVEDAATDALAFILNKSKPCRDALVDLVTDDTLELNQLSRVRTQVIRDDASRLDLAGYDGDGSLRLIIESKFGASLLEGQASRYIRHLDPIQTGVLLFVAPERRLSSLWAEINKQMDGDEDHQPFEAVEAEERLRVARVGRSNKRIVLSSWTRLLEHLKGAASELALVSEIEQLLGLATSQGDRRFTPLHSEDLGTSVPRRIHDLYRVVDDLVDVHGVGDQWMDVKRLRAAGGWDGYGRNFRFANVEGQHWIGVSFSFWGAEEGLPIWLYLDTKLSAAIDSDAVRRRLGLGEDWEPEEEMWVPIRLRTGAIYEDVVDDVVCQVKTVYDIALEASAGNS